MGPALLNPEGLFTQGSSGRWYWGNPCPVEFLSRSTSMFLLFNWDTCDSGAYSTGVWITEKEFRSQAHRKAQSLPAEMSAA